MNVRVITEPMVISYPVLEEPRATPSGDLKYSCSLIANIADNPKILDPLKAAVLEVARDRWGPKADAMIKAKQLKMPFRDGAGKEGSAGYGPGKAFFSAASKQQPGLVDRYAGPDGKPRPITDPGGIYPGCLVRASLTVFAYDQAGGRGVGFGLNALQKLGDGERLDGRVDAVDVFTALEPAPAELEGADDGGRMRRRPPAAGDSELPF